MDNNQEVLKEIQSVLSDLQNSTQKQKPKAHVKTEWGGDFAKGILFLIVVLSFSGGLIYEWDKRLNSMNDNLMQRFDRAIERIDARVTNIEKDNVQHITALNARKIYEEERISKIEAQNERMIKELEALKVQIQQLEMLLTRRSSFNLSYEPAILVYTEIK